MRLLIPLIAFAACAMAGEKPSGQGSAEGVATDLWKAVLFSDGQLYRQVQNPKLMKNAELEKAVLTRSMLMEKENQKIIGAIADKPGQEAPVIPAVLAVYRMGKISATSAIETARKEFRFKEIGFVDVEVRHGGKRPHDMSLSGRSRTFVVQDEDGKWYALDRPNLFPALTQGLQDEKPTGAALWEAPPEPAPVPSKDPKEKPRKL